MNPRNLSNQFRPVQLGFDPRDDIDLGKLNERNAAAAKADNPVSSPSSGVMNVGPYKPKQLAMLYTARDLIDMNPLPADRQPIEDYEYHEDDDEDDYQAPREDNEEFWERKLGESKMRGLHERIEKRIPGTDDYTARVESPVHVYHSRVWDDHADHDDSRSTIAQGHHRIASAYEIDPRAEVPVFNFDWEDGPVEMATHPQQYDPDSERKYGLKYTGMPQYGGGFRPLR